MQIVSCAPNSDRRAADALSLRLQEAERLGGGRSCRVGCEFDADPPRTR